MAQQEYQRGRLEKRPPMKWKMTYAIDKAITGWKNKYRYYFLLAH